MLRRHARTSRGMTLIELMVTLAIAAVLMFTVVPDIASWLRNIQIRNAAESIQTGLQRARNEAVRRNAPVQFSLVALGTPTTMDNSCALSAVAGSWVVSLRNPAGKCGMAASDTVDPMLIDAHPIADGGRSTAITATQADGTAASSIVFDAFGRATSAGSIVRIDVSHATATTGVRPLSIRLTTGGSVRMCDPNVSSTTDPRHC